MKNKELYPVVEICCFGGFEVFYKGVPISFKRKKSKELLAFLVDKKGMGVTNEQIAEVLFEGKEYNRGTKGAVQKIISTLRSDLRQLGIDDIICHHWNSLSIIPNKVKCDYFDYINGNEDVLLKYAGDYMCCYTWAEYTNGYIEMHMYK